jgi:hypothetical protein
VKHNLSTEIMSIIASRGGRFVREINDPIEFIKYKIPYNNGNIKAWVCVDNESMSYYYYYVSTMKRLYKKRTGFA